MFLSKDFLIVQLKPSVTCTYRYFKMCLLELYLLYSDYWPPPPKKSHAAWYRCDNPPNHRETFSVWWTSFPVCLSTWCWDQSWDDWVATNKNQEPCGSGSRPPTRSWSVRGPNLSTFISVHLQLSVISASHCRSDTVIVPSCRRRRSLLWI